MDNTNGFPSHDDLENARWFTSRASSANGGCLEVSFPKPGFVGLRDNEDPTNPPFVVTEHVWKCFLDGANGGEFNTPA
ncbi:DUF397 domain-containing protein [Streptomyces celluloflavus]|uniref:DUF397 domain-containing protein n=1 Tax=Streptomyces celluloflavus TaxID=58344 RepID=UPI0036A08508